MIDFVVSCAEPDRQIRVALGEFPPLRPGRGQVTAGAAGPQARWVRPTGIYPTFHHIWRIINA